MLSTTYSNLSADQFSEPAKLRQPLERPWKNSMLQIRQNIDEFSFRQRLVKILER